MWDIFNGILGILPFINSWCYTGSTIWWTRLFLCRIFIKGCQNFDCSFSPKKVTILCFYNFGAKIVISFSCLKEKCNTCSIFIQTLTHPKSVSKSFQKWRVWMTKITSEDLLEVEVYWEESLELSTLSLEPQRRQPCDACSSSRASAAVLKATQNTWVSFRQNS